jgi:hypothetical protein
MIFWPKKPNIEANTGPEPVHDAYRSDKHGIEISEPVR